MTTYLKLLLPRFAGSAKIAICERRTSASSAAIAIPVTGKSKGKRSRCSSSLLYRVAGSGIGGRTVPSFRLALAEEESEWKVYRQHLDKSERRDFDNMFAIPRLYLSACSGAVKLVRIYPVYMSIALHHYKELLQMAEELGLRKEEEIFFNVAKP
jgi:hypothetical protein